MFSTEIIVSLLTLTSMEIVLGIDNIVFLSILAGKLPVKERGLARKIGLALALIMRLGLLLAISWVMGLTASLFSVANHGFSGRDLILVLGGLFLVGKATHEIHDKLEISHGDEGPRAGKAAFGWVLAQIVVLDIVFSLDSVITAVGMAQSIPVMMAAMVIAVLFMLWFSAGISAFIERHPSLKILALSFLILIGVTLLLDGMGRHVGKGYVYFAMAFSLAVEFLNLRMRTRSAPVALHGRFEKAVRRRGGKA